MLLFIKSALRGLQTETCYFNKSLYISHASLVEQDIIEYISIQNSKLNFLEKIKFFYLHFMQGIYNTGRFKKGALNLDK